jgi:ribonuclease HII
MWTQLADYGEITNISESLLLYRIVPNSLTSQSKRNIEQRKRVYKEIISSKLTRLKIEPTKHIDLHFELAEIHNLKLTKYTLDDYQAYLTNLIEANKKEQYFDETSLKMECAAQFYNCCVVKGDFKAFYDHEFNQILNVNRAKFYKDRLIFIGKKQVKRKVRS